MFNMGSHECAIPPLPIQQKWYFTYEHTDIQTNTHISSRKTHHEGEVDLTILCSRKKTGLCRVICHNGKSSTRFFYTLRLTHHGFEPQERCLTNSIIKTSQYQGYSQPRPVNRPTKMIFVFRLSQLLPFTTGII